MASTPPAAANSHLSDSQSRDSCSLRGVWLKNFFVPLHFPALIDCSPQGPHFWGVYPAVLGGLYGERLTHTWLLHVEVLHCSP